jgi:3-oxoacyl-[acyl-carrier protein] reductase
MKKGASKMRLEDKVAMLTAAAGAGIGQATARAMAKEGARIIVTDAHARRPFAVAEAIQKDFGVETLGMQCDVNDREQIEAAAKAGLDKFGRIDILFNNAGINRLSPVVDMTDDVWDLVINTCLRGTFYACRAVLPSMIAQRFGRIVNVASVAGFMGLGDGQAHYAAAKAGIMAFTRCLALEVAPHSITANTIAPGFIYNAFLARIYPEDEVRRMYEGIPYPRKGTPQDIANIAVFLCSDEGEYVTGQTICASGGSWMH